MGLRPLLKIGPMRVVIKEHLLLNIVTLLHMFLGRIYCLLIVESRLNLQLTRVLKEFPNCHPKIFKGFVEWGTFDSESEGYVFCVFGVNKNLR